MDTIFNPFTQKLQFTSVGATGEQGPRGIPGPVNIDTDVTLSANSDSLVASQKATKAYVNSLRDLVIKGFRVVATNGNDTTGNGSYQYPFLTFAAAFASITDASPTNRYTVYAMPGRYTESTWLHPANVFVVGFDYKNTYITVTTGGFTLDPVSFHPAGDHRSGLFNINVRSALNIDYRLSTTLGSNEGKFYMGGCQLITTSTFTAFSNINQMIFDKIDNFGDLVLNACNTTLRDFQGFGGNIIVNAVTGRGTILVLENSNQSNNVTINGLSDSTQVALSNSTISGNLALSGSGTVVWIDSVSYPSGTLTIGSGVTFTQTTPGASIKNDSSVTGSTVKDAINALNTNKPDVSTGTSAPISIPTKVGNLFIDTNNKKIYCATGTSNSSD